MTSLLSFLRGRPAGPEVAVVPLVQPHATIDGWTLTETPLERSVPRDQQRELCTLLHGIAVHVETPYTYLRALDILEHCGERAQAYAVCEAWLGQPASKRPGLGSATRSITRHRYRLRARLAAAAGRPSS